MCINRSAMLNRSLGTGGSFSRAICTIDARVVSWQTTRQHDSSRTHLFSVWHVLEQACHDGRGQICIFTSVHTKELVHNNFRLAAKARQENG